MTAARKRTKNRRKLGIKACELSVINGGVEAENTSCGTVVFMEPDTRGTRFGWSDLKFSREKDTNQNST